MSKGEEGFTLIELMISLALFGLLAMAGFALVDGVLGIQARTAGRLDRAGGYSARHVRADQRFWSRWAAASSAAAARACLQPADGGGGGAAAGLHPIRPCRRGDGARRHHTRWRALGHADAAARASRRFISLLGRAAMAGSSLLAPQRRIASPNGRQRWRAVMTLPPSPAPGGGVLRCVVQLPARP